MRRNAPAFVVLEVLLGIVLVVMITMLLAMTLLKQQHVAGELADQRAAVRRLESVLSSLQVTDGGGDSAALEGIAVRRLPDPPPAEGYVWMQVSKKVGRVSIELTGPVRVHHADALPNFEEPPSP